VAMPVRVGMIMPVWVGMVGEEMIVVVVIQRPIMHMRVLVNKSAVAVRMAVPGGGHPLRIDGRQAAPGATMAAATRLALPHLRGR